MPHFNHPASVTSGTYEYRQSDKMYYDACVYVCLVFGDINVELGIKRLKRKVCLRDVDICCCINCGYILSST